MPVPVEEHVERTSPTTSSLRKESLLVAPVPAKRRSLSPAATKRQNLRRSLHNCIAPPILGQATAALSTEVVRELLSYWDALEQTYSKHWKSAMRSEFSSLI